MMARYSRALLSLALLGLLAACGGTAATTTPAAVATTAPATATPASAAPAAAASPTTAATPRAATSAATPATPRATPATPGTPATPTRAASPATGATPARPASPVAPGGGTVMTDADNQCQVTLPANFTPDPAGGGSAVSADEQVGVNLLSFPVDPFGFEGATDFIIGTISASVEGYREIDRQSGNSRGRPFTSISFEGTSLGEPVAGRFYFVQEGTNVCALTVVMRAAAASQYAAAIDAMIESIQAVRP